MIKITEGPFNMVQVAQKARKDGQDVTPSKKLRCLYRWKEENIEENID